MESHRARLSDADGIVAHALQIVVHLQDGDDKPQILRNGLIQGQDLQAFLLDLDLAPVDFAVALDHALGSFGIAPKKGSK